MPINKLSMGFKMGETLKVLGRNFAKAIPANGIALTIEQFSLLNTINTKEEITQQELSFILKKDKSGILRLTDELERKRMVVRITDTSDRRKKSLMLTKKGLVTLNKVLKIESLIVKKLLSGVNEKELNIFSKVLTKITQNGKV